MKEFIPNGAKFFPLEVDTTEKGDNNLKCQFHPWQCSHSSYYFSKFLFVIRKLSRCSRYKDIENKIINESGLGTEMKQLTMKEKSRQEK